MPVAPEATNSKPSPRSASVGPSKSASSVERSGAAVGTMRSTGTTYGARPMLKAFVSRKKTCTCNVPPPAPPVVDVVDAGVPAVVVVADVELSPVQPRRSAPASTTPEVGLTLVSQRAHRAALPALGLR